MIRVLLSLLLLEVCVGTIPSQRSDLWTSFGSSLSSDDEHPQRVARDVAERKAFGEKGDYISTVIYLDVPPLPDSVSVGFASEKTDEFSILFNHVSFSKLSSVYAYLYRIDLDAKVVQLVLRLSKAYINGTYCLSTPSTPSTAYDDFEVNLYADLLYMHEMPFHTDEKGHPTFGKTENPRLIFKKVKGRYTNAPSALGAEPKNYLSPKLLEAVVEKIHEETRSKLQPDHVAYQIKSEMAFKQRSHLAGRLEKAMSDAFADVHINCFNIFYTDKTNFNRIIANYDVTIPTFVLRDVEKFIVEDLKISFVDENVHARGVFRISSPLAVLRVVYRKRNDPSAPSHSFKAEYEIENSYYEFELIAKPETGTVEVGNIGVHVSGASVAPSQGTYGDERDLIIKELKHYIKVYYPNNGYFAFAAYIQGLVNEGRIAHDTFKNK